MWWFSFPNLFFLPQIFCQLIFPPKQTCANLFAVELMVKQLFKDKVFDRHCDMTGQLYYSVKSFLCGISYFSGQQKPCLLSL